MSGTSSNVRILVVDDEAGFRSLLSWRLNKWRWEIVTAANGHEAVDLIRQRPFELVVTDLTMPEMGGLSLLKELQLLTPATPVIVITGFATVETAVCAMQLGACDVLLKPFELAQLHTSIHRALQKSTSPP
jgi:DNA-binding NtrC family response regulator